MKIIDVSRPPKEIWLGRDGENNWRPIAFECASWFSKLPDGIVTVWMEAGGSKFPLAVNMDGTKSVWYPQQEELFLGKSRIEVAIQNDEKVGTSAIIDCHVDESLIGDGEHPAETAPPWTVKVIEDVAAEADRAEEAVSSIDSKVETSVNEKLPEAVEDYFDEHPVVVDETDPTVPTWAKQPNKPTYTAREVGALPAGTPIPPAVTEQTVAGWGFTKNAGTYNKPVGGIPDSDIASAETWNSKGTYSKPSGGIPASDLAPGVIPDVSGKANAADVAALVSRLNAIADSDDTTLDQLSEIVAYIKNNKSLIDNITTGKVSVSDIVDNLTSSATNKPLSANQGRALKALIDAIVVPTESTVSGWGFTKNTGTYSKPSGGIPKTDLAQAVQTSLGKADTALQQHQSLTAYRTSAAQDTIDAAQDTAIAAKYTKPSTGIPKTDLASDVKASLDKADTALQEHQSLASYRTASAQDAIDNAQNVEIGKKANSADLAAVAMSGSYNDLADKPSIPSLAGYATQTWVEGKGYLTLANLPVYNGGVS